MQENKREVPIPQVLHKLSRRSPERGEPLKRDPFLLLYQIYVELDVLALSKISLGWGVNCTTAKKMYCKKNVQLPKKLYNCKINGTIAKLYVGIIQEISTTAKKWHNCKKKRSNEKTNAQLQKQMHNCKTHLLQLHYYSFPCSYVTQQWPSWQSCHQQSPQPLLESQHGATERCNILGCLGHGHHFFIIIPSNDGQMLE